MNACVSRVCRLCSQEKLLIDFYKNKNCISGGGVDSKCKTCSKQMTVRGQRADKHRARKSEWAKRKWASSAEFRKRQLENSRRYFSREDVKKSQAQKLKARISANRDTYLQQRRERYRERSAATILHSRVAARLRGLIKEKKDRPTFEIFGYSKIALMQHLERQFLSGMNWQNMGKWHIDHIVPLSSFNISAANDPALRVAWGLPNLRPLWAADNLRKKAKRLFLL